MIMEIIFKLLVFLSQSINSFVFLYELPIMGVKNTGHMSVVRQTAMPIQFNLLPMQIPQTSNCYIENKIVNCNIMHNSFSNINFGFDQTPLLKYPLDSHPDTNLKIYRRSNNGLPEKWSNKVKANSTKYSTAAKVVQGKQTKKITATPPNPVGNRKVYRNMIGQLLSQANSNTSATVSESKDIYRPSRTIFDAFVKAHENFDRKLYSITFNKLLQISPQDRRVNGISFVESGLFLQLILLALTDEVSPVAKTEIDKCIGLYLSKSQRISLLNKTIAELPISSNDIKFYWSYRLVLWPGTNVSQEFRKEAASVLRLHINHFNGTERPDQIAKVLNEMVEKDSGGAIRDTFEEDDVSNGVEAVMLTTMYMRARWRSAPTVLNGSRPFRDADDAPERMIRMIRINDMMRYADITEWNAQAVEIFYATRGLSLLLLVPRSRSLQNLAAFSVAANINDIVRRMRYLRVSAVLPLYTLRMTLLLPNKLQDMGVTSLLNTGSNHTRNQLNLSHAVQRLMFWAEAGRNAFKDDGIEWDESPEMELVVDRPYIFFVRWNNLTLMNGNFAL